MGPCPLGLLSPLNHQFLVVQPVLSMEIKFPISKLRRAEAHLSVARAAAGVLGPEEIKPKQEQAIEALAELPRTLSKLSAADQNRVLSELV